jgi:hypothetical protein
LKFLIELGRECVVLGQFLEEWLLLMRCDASKFVRQRVEAGAHEYKQESEFTTVS